MLNLINSFIVIFLISPLAAHAAIFLDLTDPKNMSTSEVYPSYEALQVVNFNDTKANMAIFGLKSDKASKDWDILISVSISESKGGKQSIYITLDTKCTDKEKEYGEMTVKTNDQNVRYSKYCDGKNIYITPRSMAGKSFLRDEFLKKQYVAFIFEDIFVTFDASGFTKAWNNFGGDAI